MAGFIEEVSLVELVEDAIRINSASLGRHHVEIVREFEELPPARLAKQKFLQVVVNLLSNAKYAVMQGDDPDRRIVVRLGASGTERVRLEVTDTGIVRCAPAHIRQIGVGDDAANITGATLSVHGGWSAV